MARYLSDKEIQAAWCRTSEHKDARQYRISPRGGIVCSADDSAGVLIGCYDRNVSYEDFRSDVRFVVKSVLQKK